MSTLCWPEKASCGPCAFSIHHQKSTGVENRLVGYHSATREPLGRPSKRITVTVRTSHKPAANQHTHTLSRTHTHTLTHTHAHTHTSLRTSCSRRFGATQKESMSTVKQNLRTCFPFDSMGSASTGFSFWRSIGVHEGCHAGGIYSHAVQWSWQPNKNNSSMPPDWG